MGALGGKREEGERERSKLLCCDWWGGGVWAQMLKTKQENNRLM